MGPHCPLSAKEGTHSCPPTRTPASTHNHTHRSTHARTRRVGALGVGVAALHKGLHLLQVAELEEVEAAPLQLVVVELQQRQRQQQEQW